MNRRSNRLATDRSNLVMGLPRWTAEGRGTVEPVVPAPLAPPTEVSPTDEQAPPPGGPADPLPEAPDDGGLARLGSLVFLAHERIAEANVAHQRAVARVIEETDEEVARILGLAPSGVRPVPHSTPDPATATAPRAPLPHAPARTGRRRFLHVDIVLPMFAVLIVLVILLAWVG